ncbi:DUF1269 domain-containing protein [Streptomyces sp. NPDC091376]|uniref:DUF1269 domain-containing protein n=1 Tax=Streptomyces sp. NPDC091376 TaxID=3365994 RepID=UPI003822D6C3
MTFVEKHRFAGGRTERDLLRISWEGEIFGVGLFETLTEMYPQHAEQFTACATMEWFNVHYCEPFGHDAGVHITLEQAEKLGRDGAALARGLHSFKNVAKLTAEETREVDPLYKMMAKHAHTPELKALAEDLLEHEDAMRDWLKSELEGNSDSGTKIFAYLDRHGISREEAVTPRRLREDAGGDRQQLVLAFFPDEESADQAARSLKNWEKATEYMKVDAIGVLVRDSHGKVKEHKLGRRAGKKGMGVGVALGVIAAIPTGGLSLAGGALAAGAGGGVIGEFFHKGLKMTDEDMASIGRELDDGRTAVGVLTWDFETDAVAGKLKDLGGTIQTLEVAQVETEAQGHTATEA